MVDGSTEVLFHYRIKTNGGQDECYRIELYGETNTTFLMQVYKLVLYFRKINAIKLNCTKKCTTSLRDDVYNVKMLMILLCELVIVWLYRSVNWFI